MSSIKTVACTIFGALGACVVKVFGCWDKDMTTLITLMAIDFVMGLVIAAVFKNSPKSVNGAVDSSSCFEGLCKKCMILLFVLVAHRLDVSLGVNYIKTTAIIGFIANEAISVIENAGIMGMPLPKVFIRAIDILKKEDDDDEEYF